MKGTIVKLVEAKGFGFIRSESGDVFFHCSELQGGLEFDATLQERRVLFETVESERGRKAYNVRPAGD